jgi:hypothetical protein
MNSINLLDTKITMMYQSNEKNLTKEEHLAAAAILASFAEQTSRSRIQIHATPSLTNEHMMSRPFFVPTISSNRATEAPSSTQLLFPKFKKPFPLELLEILNNNDHDDIIRWIPNGKAFIILDKERLTTELLPLYFKKTQFASFARKLTRWDFKRVSKGPYAGAYYHMCFQRDSDRPCSSVTCDGTNSELSNMPNAPTCRKVVSSIPTPNYNRFDCRNPPSRAASSPSPLSALQSSVTMKLLAHEEKELLEVRKNKLIRFRMTKFRSEHKWHRQQFTRLYANKSTVLCRSRNNIPQYPQHTATSHHPKMTANNIIKEATEVLEESFTLGLSRHNKTRHNHQQSVLRQEPITLEKYHGKFSYYDPGCTKRSLQKFFDINNPRASAA